MATVIDRLKLPDSTQLDTLNGKLDTINTTLAGQEFVTKDNIVSALGYEPQPQEGQYELINSVTTTEEVTYINLTADKDGNAFDLVHGCIKTTCPTSMTSAILCSVYYRGKSDEGSLSLSAWARMFTGTTGNAYYWIHRFGSRVETLFEYFNATNSITQEHNIMVKEYTNPHITSANLYVSAKVPVGVTIELYGIRA